MKESSTRSASRLGLAEAKAGLSRAVREAEARPTIIHNRGRDVAVLLSIEEYRRLRELEEDERSPLASFLDDVEGLKRRLGGGRDLEPARVDYQPRDPFARKGR